jgi:hypothetical protein
MIWVDYLLVRISYRPIRDGTLFYDIFATHIESLTGFFCYMDILNRRSLQATV